jgi:hypothetical protein
VFISEPLFCGSTDQQGAIRVHVSGIAFFAAEDGLYCRLGERSADQVQARRMSATHRGRLFPLVS